MRATADHNLERLFPAIAAEWNYAENDAPGPQETAPYSARRVSWICAFNPQHIWTEVVSSRTGSLSGCPFCNRQFHSSYPARVLAHYLQVNGIACVIEKRISRYAIDILIPSPPCGGRPIAVEVDGHYHHRRADIVLRDTRKDEYLKTHGYRVIRVKDLPTDTPTVWFENDVLYYPNSPQHRYLDEAVGLFMKEVFDKIIRADHRQDHPQIEQEYLRYRQQRSLAVTHPHLANEWSTRNTDTPDVICAGSGQKRWWTCPDCKRDYEAIVAARARIGTECPYCKHRVVAPETCLAALYPHIAAEWDAEKNSPLTPTDVLPGREKQVWWKCKEGHSWKTWIYLRTGVHKSGCPVCHKKATIPETSLAAVMPALVPYWYQEKNPCSPDTVAPRSHIRYWWRCPEGHEWQISPDKIRRTSFAENPALFCPYCNGRRVWEHYSLASKFPELVSWWHPEKNTGTPDETAPYSNKMIWWRCPEGHEWQNTPNTIWRTTPANRCPYCSGRLAWKDNCLATASPRLAKEWIYERNLPLTPETVLPGSGKRVWWRCEKGHEWEYVIEQRYKRNHNCPYCSHHRKIQQR